jgi:hypothetical protein
MALAGAEFRGDLLLSRPVPTSVMTSTAPAFRACTVIGVSAVI